MSDLSVDQLLEEKIFQPTEEQQHIITAALSSNSSLMITAMAGCGKSTVLEILARKLPKVSTCYIVFNKKNQIEAQREFLSFKGKLSSFGSASHVDILTANGLGHRAWQRAISQRITLNTKKIGEITKELLKRERIQTAPEDFISIIQLVSKARHSGLVPKVYPSIKGLLPDTTSSWEQISDYIDLSEELLYVARKVLTESIQQSYRGIIDFDDQIYMSTLFGGVFPRYQVTMVDEAQDLSPLNHLQLKRTAADRLIVVGDPRQAIYAFRGADSQSMDSLRTLREEWIDLPLSTTFRCPKVIVERQQSHARGFRAAASNRVGAILEWTSKKSWTVPEGRVAILCRNNAPLFAAALKLIKSGRGCTVLGKEIGKSLITLAKKVVPNGQQDSGTSQQLLSSYFQKEIQLARSNGKEERIAILNDKQECFEAIFEGSGARTMQEALRALEKMFSSENLLITLSTGHKAKGLEWPTVIHLDPWRIPSKFAKQAAAEGNNSPLEQDLNLRYVIETRAQETLILARKEQME